MPRRRELADAADGITGHFMFDSPANPEWPLARIAFAVRAGHGAEYSFDLLDGTVSSASEDLIALARFLRDDLSRHLAARRIDRDWVTAATLVVVAEATTPGTRAPVRCAVSITDDRGRSHTAARRATMAVPPVPLTTRIADWFRTRRSK